MSVEVESVRTVEVPTRMVHGPGAISRLGELVKELGVQRPFLVTDGGVVSAGLVLVLRRGAAAPGRLVDSPAPP